MYRYISTSIFGIIFLNGNTSPNNHCLQSAAYMRTPIKIPIKPAVIININTTKYENLNESRMTITFDLLLMYFQSTLLK